MLGDEVRKARLDRGWSQECLAGRVHKTKSWVSKVERGRCEPSRSAVRALYRILPLPLDAVTAFLTEEDLP